MNFFAKQSEAKKETKAKDTKATKFPLKEARESILDIQSIVSRLKMKKNRFKAI